MLLRSFLAIFVSIFLWLSGSFRHDRTLGLVCISVCEVGIAVSRSRFWLHWCFIGCGFGRFRCKLRRKRINLRVGFSILLLLLANLLSALPLLELSFVLYLKIVSVKRLFLSLLASLLQALLYKFLCTCIFNLLFFLLLDLFLCFELLLSSQYLILLLLELVLNTII